MDAVSTSPRFVVACTSHFVVFFYDASRRSFFADPDTATRYATREEAERIAREFGNAEPGARFEVEEA